MARSFPYQEESIEEEPSVSPCSRRSCDRASSSSGGCCNYRCGERHCYTQQRRFSRQQSRRRPRAATRINSFPKFLAKHHRRPSRTITSISSVDDDPPTGLVASKSSPELRIEQASTSGERQRRGASFFTGEDDDDNDEIVDLEVKQS